MTDLGDNKDRQGDRLRESSDFVLETRGLTKNYKTTTGELEVLRGIDLKVANGEFVSITGPSGVGKSTLLHILGGLDQPTAGEVKVCGHQLEGLSDTDASRYRNKEVGFIFQFHYLLEEFDALENVMMPLMIRGEARNKSRSRALKLLDEVGLAERTTHRPAQLSGGERQRVAVARALSGEPRLLIADEPTGDLDSKTAVDLHELLDHLNHDHDLTIIVATHDMSLADRAGTTYQMVAGQLLGRA
jgi:lipoprotein-releasing system ATP-binding protein